MFDSTGFSGVSLVEGVDVQRLAGVQLSLLAALEDIELWVGRLRDGADSPFLLDEALTQIESAVSVCDGQLSVFGGGWS